MRTAAASRLTSERIAEAHASPLRYFPSTIFPATLMTASPRARATVVRQNEAIIVKPDNTRACALPAAAARKLLQQLLQQRSQTTRSL